VARALVFEPKLVLMDEPLGALDKQLREQMQFEIRALHQRLGVTMVYVTHDQSEALTMSDRIAVFHHGRIQQLSDPRCMYEQPANGFVAGFIGESNRLPGTVESVGGERAALRMGSGALLHGAGSDGLALGANAVYALRPERIEIAPVASDGCESLPATLEEAIFMGDRVRLRLRLAGGAELVATRPIDRAGDLPAAGTAVRACWRVEHARVFSVP